MNGSILHPAADPRKMKKEGRPLGRPSQTLTQKLRSEANAYFLTLHGCENAAALIVPSWKVVVSR
jgi:hypothetical protein